MYFESALYKIGTYSNDVDKAFTIKSTTIKQMGLITPTLSCKIYKQICYRANWEEDLDKVPDMLLGELYTLVRFHRQKF